MPSMKALKTMKAPNSMKAIKAMMKAVQTMKAVRTMKGKKAAAMKKAMKKIFNFYTEIKDDDSKKVQYRKRSAKWIRLRMQMLMLMKRKKAFLEKRRKEEEAFQRRVDAHRDLEAHRQKLWFEDQAWYEELCEKAEAKLRVEAEQEWAERMREADENAERRLRVLEEYFKQRRLEVDQKLAAQEDMHRYQERLYVDLLKKADKDKEDAWQKVEEMEKMMKINSAFEKKMIGPFLSASSQKVEEDAWQKVEDDGEDDHLASSSSSDEA